MAKKQSTPAPKPEHKSRVGRARKPKSVRKHIRWLKSQGRDHEAAGIAKTADDHLQAEHSE